MTGVARLRVALRRGPLAIRNFRLLSVGQLASTIGDYCYAVALPWLVLSAHGGPALLGAVLACYGVPRTVLMPVGGVLADRLGPRAIMLVADTLRCVLVAALAVVAARQVDSLAVLGPIAALLGAGEGMFLPASFAIMPGLLEPELLQTGNALAGAMVQAGSLAGPVLGGIMVATAGPAPAFAVDAASFAVSAAALALIRPGTAAVTSAADHGDGSAQRSAGPPATAGPPAAGPAAGAGPPAAEPPAGASQPARAEPPTAGRPTARAAKPSVWPLLRSSRLLQVILLISVMANFTFAGTFEVALPALAHARYGPGGYGALLACFAAGSLAGTLAAARGARLRRPVVVVCAGYLLASSAVGLLPFLGGLPGAAMAGLILGACTGFGNVIVVTLLQQWAPRALLGRVMSLVMLASMGSFPVSVALSGALVHSIGPAPFFPVAGLVLGTVVLFGLTQPELRQFGAPAPGAPGLAAEAG